MDHTRLVVETIRQEVTENNLQLKALIQDIDECVGPLVELQALNSAGRSKISTLRKLISKFSDLATETKSTILLKDVALYREQFANSMDAFKKANLKSMSAIEQGTKEELVKHTAEDTDVRQRQKRNKENMATISSNVTDQLLSISRQLADTTQRSANTLESLVYSSDSVIGTQEELKVTSSVIGQSGKLLAKYGRREFTDKILMCFAFAFFICCVVYIVQKRLF
ncbi:vesicle transport protein SEC20 [Diabrotica virgifera virgifera]|uniref:Vesicle transport protein SEC20 n=1 Tax=Diabrotica virgifera virgifera TaxID=50390 RepID=A0A6P7GSU4_DIAVI|nr:vesicle transport protein SEC20 [Diabrotica virgifera virgifera]